MKKKSFSTNTTALEVNFDGLVGNTHNYSGLSLGNIASKLNQFAVSNPREAALQGLEKMKFLSDRGISQAVLPPHIRPNIAILRFLGFDGKDAEILAKVYKQSPSLLLEVASSASMWSANAATISASANTADHKVHITPANLSAKFHRSIEQAQTAQILKQIFKDEDFFVHHPCLPPGQFFSDEGAANHMHLCNRYGDPGMDIFVYGRIALNDNGNFPKRFPARQTLEASQAISRLHKLGPALTCFTQQHPKAIDAGAFHNDVVALSNQNVLLFHEDAFLNKNGFLEEVRRKAATLPNLEINFVQVKQEEISLEDAISSYLFNSQLVTLSDGKMLLVAPIECQEKKHIKHFIDTLLKSPNNPISEVTYLNLRQSMQNGGGPACLRLRAILNPEELQSINQNVLLNNALYETLKKWIVKYYRDKLSVQDLSDPQLLEETYQSLDELGHILNLKILSH